MSTEPKPAPDLMAALRASLERPRDAQPRPEAPIMQTPDPEVDRRLLLASNRELRRELREARETIDRQRDEIERLRGEVRA